MHGPHNNHFYALLRTLTDEFLEARRLGYWPGACFLGTGVRLGGASVPPAQLKERRTLAAASALRRQQLQAAPTRLGGAPPTKSLRELAAEVCGALFLLTPGGDAAVGGCQDVCLGIAGDDSCCALRDRCTGRRGRIR